jgi:hypothetical protein
MCPLQSRRGLGINGDFPVVQERVVPAAHSSIVTQGVSQWSTLRSYDVVPWSVAPRVGETPASVPIMTSAAVIRRPPRESAGNTDTPHAVPSYAPASPAPPARRVDHLRRGRVAHSTGHQDGGSRSTHTAQDRAMGAFSWRRLPLSILAASQASGGLWR